MDSNYFDNLIKILKDEYKHLDAPVITFIAIKGASPYEILISTLLSLRTKDEVTIEATLRLFNKAKTPQEMLKLTEDEIKELIYPVGFYKRKATQILQISKIIIEKFSSIVPDNIDDLLTLPGVGKKTANLVLIEGYKKDAICVDVHVHRISNRLGIIKTKNPEETEFALMEILPKKYWIIYNELLVAYGQKICRPISPYCSQCKIYALCKRVNVSKHR